MHTRRDFLSISFRAAPLFLMPGIPAAAFGAPWQVSAPGLFFSASDVPRLRELFRKADVFAPLRIRLEQVDHENERRFMSAEADYRDHLYHLPRLCDTAQQMAFYYAMTGVEQAGELAADAVRTLMKFPKWDYFLEAGEHVFGLQRAPAATMAVSLSTDWLGDLVGDEEKNDWIRAMGKRGCEPSFRGIYGMRHPERVVGWTIDEASTYFEHRPGDRAMDLTNWPLILDRTNLKAVPASALATGAVAYQERFGRTPRTERWLEQAVYSLDSIRHLFARDGSYDEGVSYANYTALHMAQATSVLARKLGIDLYDVLNWPGYAEYLTEMSMPTTLDPGGIVNFGDNSTGATAAVPLWIAGRSFDGRSRWFADHLAAGHDEWALIWHDGSVAPEPPPAQAHVWHSDLDWIVARTGYTPDDLVVAMRSGGPANHEHADRNSIIVKCHGEQLVTDPHRPPYGFSDPAWMMRMTSGHSAVLIDGHGHQYHDGREGTNPSEAEARIVRLVEREGFSAWTSDATPAYGMIMPDIKSVTRTVIVLYEMPAILLLDKVLKRNKPSRLEARYFAYNMDGHGRVVASETGFLTSRPGASLHGRALSPAGVAIRDDRLPIPEETARLHPFAAVETRTPSLSPFLITVLLPLRSGAAEPMVDIREAGDGVYEVLCRQGPRMARCRIIDSDMIPEFHITL
jgi:hypothetical protein